MLLTLSAPMSGGEKNITLECQQNTSAYTAKLMEYFLKRLCNYVKNPLASTAGAKTEVKCRIRSFNHWSYTCLKTQPAHGSYF